MIIRILNEGQWQVTEDHVSELNKLDSAVEQAVEAGNEDSFAQTLAALLEAVRSWGMTLPDESLEDSDLILPPSDATLDEVKAMLTDDGLIPG